jgi:hypothetical protein
VSEMMEQETRTDLVPTNGSTQDLTLDLTLARDPSAVLQEAQRAAAALKDVIDRKAKPVRLNGETYLEFEDWQTVGRFYGVAAKVVETRPVEAGEVRGWEARAVAIHAASGIEVSAADSMCLNDEPNWRNKPSFQLRSMAQTRACAKALRNVLSWVVVLGGYRPTPAEEMDWVVGQAAPAPAPTPAPAPAPAGNGRTVGCTCAGKRHHKNNPKCPLNGSPQTELADPDGWVDPDVPDVPKDAAPNKPNHVPNKPNQ